MHDRKVNFLEIAHSEIQEAYDWYADRNLNISERFLQELDLLVTRISQTPRHFTEYQHATRIAIFRGFPYHLIFRELESSIEILAVCHSSRKPSYWSDRIS